MICSRAREAEGDDGQRVSECYDYYSERGVGR